MRQQTGGKLLRGPLADPAGRDSLGTDMDHASKKRAGRQHQSAGAQFPPIGQDEAGNPAALRLDLGCLARDDRQVRHGGERRLHGGTVELTVHLRARTAHSRPLGTIENAELDAGFIRDAAHQAIERIDLADEMALAKAADGRIAGHGADSDEGMRDKRRPCAEARRRGSRLAASVPAAHHDHVEAFRAHRAIQECFT